MSKNPKETILTDQEQQEEKEFQQHGLVVASRIDAVIEIILDHPEYLNVKRAGALKELIRGNLKKKQGVEPGNRTIERYVKEARSAIRKLSRQKTEKKFEAALIKRYSHLQRAVAAKNLKEERMILKDIAELENLYPVKNINVKNEVSLKDVNLNSLTDDQVIKLRTMIASGVEIKEALLHIGVIINK